jgi:Flp pilus assembly pilin Flp
MKRFWFETLGQDLIEYTLLMAFVALASAALFLGAGSNIVGIWKTTNSTLSQAATSAGGGTGTGAGAGGPAVGGGGGGGPQ